MKYAVNGQSCRTCSCCGAILLSCGLSCGLGEGVCKVKWDREPWQCGGNSMRGFAAAPGTHLFLRRVPVDMVSCWHTVKLDCGKHHHAETDKRKNRRCFYSQILVVTAEEERNCCANNVFSFYFQKDFWQMSRTFWFWMPLTLSSENYQLRCIGTWSYSMDKGLLITYGSKNFRWWAVMDM